jgi:adenosylcobyric acid synthase
VSVAPFKAQNMALNAAVTRSGAEIGRAQAMQAAAAGLEPEAAMNPVLIKPSGARHSQVIVNGRPYADADARSYQDLKRSLRAPVLAALEDLRSRYDVVVCEGAGSPAEINLRRDDLANMGLARAADLPVLIVGDIDRGGVFASLVGTVALLEPADQALVAGFLINKFRGDASILAPGLTQLRLITGRPCLGVLPYAEGLWLDVEDSLALDAPRPLAAPPVGRDTLDVAVVRLRWISNFTDFDALAAEPGVAVRFTRSLTDIERADLVIVPGTKGTVEDLQLLRAEGLDAALRRREKPTLGICGGYQMLGRTIVDDVESRAGAVDGLGLLPVATTFDADKLVRRLPDSTAYEIRHGRPVRDGGEEFPGGCADGAVFGTSWHGLLEDDAFRRSFLARVAALAGREWLPGVEPFAAVRERHLDRLGDLVEEHVDTGALLALIEAGAPAELPVLSLGAPLCSSC